MNIKEANVVIQQMMDAKESVGHEVNEVKAEELFTKYAKHELFAGDVMIRVELTARGGNFSIKRVEKVNRAWEGYGSYVELACKENEFLIEPPNYASKHVEPYNRQSPYYIGKRISNLQSIDIMGWTVRCDLKENKMNKSNISFQTNGFHFNEYRNSAKFDAVIDSKNVEAFVSEFLAACHLPLGIIKEIIQNIG